MSAKNTKKSSAAKATVSHRGVPPSITRRPKDEPVLQDNAAIDFARKIAAMKKKSDRAADAKAAAETVPIRLTRRPTTRTKGSTSQKFPAADLAEFRKRLLRLREEVVGRSTSLRVNALERTDDRGSEDDDGADVFMRLQNLSQADQQNKVVQQIEDALHRIDEGTYGICEVCGQLIRKPRLMNLPFVHTCMECQNAMEGARH